jgi:outer membrane protein insertion porin family
LGFFEAPLPFPDIEPLENGDVDITFRVLEKQTGSVNFGTSVGGGVGLSGFIGYEQPNLFGQAKSGSLRWDFGRYLNSFELSYSDPALFQSQVSGSLSVQLAGQVLPVLDGPPEADRNEHESRHAVAQFA